MKPLITVPEAVSKVDNNDSGSRTIGVAIAIPEPWGTLLNSIRHRVGDPAARQVPTHLTLLCPTGVADGDGGIESHLADVAARTRPFELWLRNAGTFRPVTPVVYVAVASGATACARLAARIRSGPLARELRFPYHPHVTVAQEVPEDALDRAYDAVAGFSARFPVTGFTGYRRDPDGTWYAHREYPLLGRVVPAPRTRGTTSVPPVASVA